MGLRGSGKTVLLKHLLKLQPKHLVVDPLEEYDPKVFKVYRPDSILSEKCPLSPVEEMELLIAELVEPNAKADKLELFAIDEAQLFFPAREQLPFHAQSMVSLGRHWSSTNTDGLTVIYITRRPVELNTTIVELADLRVVYYLTGRNDLKYLSDICAGWDDEVASLPEYHFSVHHRRDSAGKNFHKCLPVPLDSTEKP